MKSSHSGFTLIELLIVIAIIGILAAVAIPIFRGYAVRAKLTEVEFSMSLVESALTAYRMDEDAWPNCSNKNEIRSSLGVALDAVLRISQISISNGVITVTVQNVDAMVDGKTLTLTPTPNGDGSIGWAWGWSLDFPPHLRPKT